MSVLPETSGNRKNQHAMTVKPHRALLQWCDVSVLKILQVWWRCEKAQRSRSERACDGKHVEYPTSHDGENRSRLRGNFAKVKVRYWTLTSRSCEYSGRSVDVEVRMEGQMEHGRCGFNDSTTVDSPPRWYAIQPSLVQSIERPMSFSFALT